MLLFEKFLNFVTDESLVVTFDEVPVEGLESMDTSDYIAESCSDTHQNIASE